MRPRLLLLIRLWAFEQSRPIADVARSLNIVPQTLGNWVNEYRRSHAEDGQELTVHERARIRELERRVADLEEENCFLEKAAAFFAQKRRARALPAPSLAAGDYHRRRRCRRA